MVFIVFEIILMENVGIYFLYLVIVIFLIRLLVMVVLIFSLEVVGKILVLNLVFRGLEVDY